METYEPGSRAGQDIVQVKTAELDRIKLSERVCELNGSNFSPVFLPYLTRTIENRPKFLALLSLHGISLLFIVWRQVLTVVLVWTKA